jgi:hypothetical protein
VIGVLSPRTEYAAPLRLGEHAGFRRCTMAGKGSAAGKLIRYGPVAAAAAQKWGPVVWEQVKSQRAPAEKFVQAKVAKGNQRKKAMAHAATVIDGSVLQVFHAHTAHWVVFSGDDPIAVHPPTGASFDELLDRADLSKRVRPGEGAVTIRVPKRRRKGGGTTGGTGGATAWTPHDGPGPGADPSDAAPRASGQAPTDRGTVVRGELSGRPEDPPR